MALISTKNLFSPFTNKVHLISIIFVTVLFALFRLSGGKLSMNSIERGTTSPRQESYYPATTRGERDGSLFAREPKRAAEEDSGDALSDIEKQLGMR